jgi:hypothetical protein
VLIAALIAVAVLIISPGLAISGIIAILALLACAIGFAVRTRRDRRRRTGTAARAGRSTLRR